MLSSTACDSLWRSATVSKRRPSVSFSILETKQNHRWLSSASREDGKR
jgi:hypothetical protein